MALTPIDFPDDPYTGESFTAGNGVTYTWYNNRWNGKVNDVILTVPPEDIKLRDLQDVCDTNAATGEVLTWNGTEWCPAEGPEDGVDGLTPVVTVAATNTLPAGSQANVTQAPTPDGTELTFSIPKGDKGEPGTGVQFKGTIDGAGPPEFDGAEEGDMWVDANGNAWIWEGEWIDGGDFTGPPGPPGTQVQVGTTATVEPNQPASVTESISDNTLTLNFFIPKGEQGDPGRVDGMPDGVVNEVGHYKNGNLLEGIKFGRGGGSDKYPIDFAVRTEVKFVGSVEFDSQSTVKGLFLETLDNVTGTPSNGQYLEFNNGYWRPVDGPSDSPADIDLSGYTKRSENEIIKGEWTFEERTQIAGAKVVGYTNPNSGNTSSFVHFYESKDWSEGQSADVALELDEITYGDGTKLKMLDVKGGGLQVLPLNSPPNKRGGLNLLPTGIDIWRDENDPSTAHIDFKSSNTDTDSVSGFDVRMILDTFTYGAGDSYKMLDIRGGGVQIRNHPDAPEIRQGVVNILPKGIDLITPAKPGGNFQAHIDFKNEDNLAGWDSRISMIGEIGKENLTILSKRQIIFQDETGRYSLANLAGSSGGGGGGGLPQSGYGLYYSNINTLNVNTSVIATKADIANISSGNPTFDSVDAKDIYLNGLDIRSMMGLTDVDDTSTFAVNKKFDGTWADLVSAYKTATGSAIALSSSYNECSAILNWFGDYYLKGGKILLPSKKFKVKTPIRLKYSAILIGPTGAMGNEKPKFEVIGSNWEDKIVFACTASDDDNNVVGDYKFQSLRFSANNLGVDSIISLGQRNAKSGESEDDVDSIVRYCNFEGFGGGKRKSYAIFYNGRNANIQNCSFTSSGGGTSDKYPVCIGLDFTNIENDGSNKPDSNPASSNRKNRVRFNTFHTGGSSTAIEVSGDHPNMGLLITSNVCDTGARLLDVLSGGLSGAAITANTYWKGGSKRQGIGVINIRKATGKDTIIESCTISGNGFSCLDEALGNKAEDVRLNAIINVESGVKNRGLAITGNTLCFAKDGNYAVQIDAGAEYTTVTGNVIRNSQNNRCGDNGVSPGAVVGFNVGNN